MWNRRTFHECADELKAISDDFRAAYTNKVAIGEQQRNEILEGTSKRGVEILRILALSIRSEQDSGIIPAIDNTVGALKPSASDNDVFFTLNYYRPPYSDKSNFEPLGLRDALNKIAHANPKQTDFFANDSAHDLILCGQKNNNTWIAIISLIDLCRVIKSITDRNITHD